MMNRAVKLYGLKNGKGYVILRYLCIVPCLSVMMSVTSLARASEGGGFQMEDFL